MALSEQAKKILVRATELIKDGDSWIQHELFGPRWLKMQAAIREGRELGAEEREETYCSLGAISRAARELGLREADDPEHMTEDMQEAGNAVAKAIGGGRNFFDIPSWNDAPGRTHGEVHAAFCKAVKEEVLNGEDNSEGKDQANLQEN